MSLLHLVCKMHPKITPLKLVPTVSCFNFIPVSNKLNLSYNCVQKLRKSGVPGPGLLIPTRMFWETFPDTRRYTLFEKDGIDRECYELIYRTTAFGYVFYTQLITEIALAVEMIYGTSFLIRSLMGEKMAFFENQTFNFVFDAVGFGIFSYFTIQTAVFYVLARRTVLRIYYSEEDNRYIVVFLKANPFLTEKLICKPGDLVRLPQSLYSALFGNFRLKEKRVIMNFNYFKSTFHYNHLCGSIHQ